MGYRCCPRMGIFRHPGLTLQLQSEIRLADPGGQDQEQHVDYLGHRGVALLGACAGLLQADDPTDHELEIAVAEHNAFPKPTKTRSSKMVFQPVPGRCSKSPES